jgi:alkylhydroperoxidase family enzyme
MIEEPAGPRIDPLPVDEAAPRELNIFRTLAHNEALSKAFLQLGGHLLGGGVLPVREREIVILRTGFRSGSEYEFGQHTRIGRRGGLTEASSQKVRGRRSKRAGLTPSYSSCSCLPGSIVWSPECSTVSASPSSRSFQAGRAGLSVASVLRVRNSPDPAAGGSPPACRGRGHPPH